MTTPAYMAGTLVTVTATFANEAGTVTDPTTIVLKYQLNEGAITTITYPDARITRVSTGVYQAHIDTTGVPGPATAEWIGTGTVQAISTTTWTTTPAPL